MVTLHLPLVPRDILGSTNEITILPAGTEVSIDLHAFWQKTGHGLATVPKVIH